jgi:hypothetical protein
MFGNMLVESFQECAPLLLSQSDICGCIRGVKHFLQGRRRHVDESFNDNILIF